MVIMFMYFSTGRQDLSAQGGTYCSISYNYAVNNQSASSIFPGGGTWASGNRIKVSGTFTVDQSITFDALEFIMTPGSRIIAEGSGTTLTSKNGTHFYGCSQEEMWLGIKITGSANILLNSGSVIEDAWKALEISQSANITASKVENAYLYDNVTGIYMISGTLKLGAFSGNTIKANGGLLPPPPGYSYTGSKPHFGIYLVNVKADFASNAAKRNKIEGCRVGIYALLSKLTIANFSFWNNTNDASIPTDTLDGTDILGFQSTISVGGSGLQNCDFFNAYNSAILSRDTRGLTVNGAAFDSPNKYAIRCPQSGGLYSPINITTNTIEMNGTGSVTGIYVERPFSGPGITNTLIRGNVMEVSGGHQKNSFVMIDVQGKKDAKDRVEISQNDLTSNVTYPQIHGIRITGKGNNYEIIDDNFLSWEPGATPTYSISTLKSNGIIAKDLMGANHLIADNDIVSKLNGEKSFLKAGIYLENNPLTLRTCDNRPVKNHINIFCAGGLGNTLLKSNLIGDGGYGLFCKSKTKMPNQDRFENRWTGTTYVNRGAMYEGGSNSFFIYYDPSSTITDDKPNTVYPTNGWFDELAGSNGSCTETSVDITGEERLFIDGVKLPDSTAANWDIRRELLYKLMREPELVENDEDAADYLAANEEEHSSPWLFARAEWLYDQAFGISPTVHDDFVEMVELYQFLSDSIAALDLEQAQDTVFDTGIADDRAEVFATLALVADSLDQLQTLAGPGIRAKLEATLDSVQSLPDGELYEEYLKSLLDVVLREAKGDSLVEDDFEVLRDIAAQCPAVGGISIRRAPMWLEHEEGVAYIDQDWEAACAEEFMVSAAPAPQLPAVRVTPNPANKYAEITFALNSQGAWYFSDLTGHILRTGEVDAPVKTIDVSDIPPGLYVFTCRHSNGTVSVTKACIIH